MIHSKDIQTIRTGSTIQLYYKGTFVGSYADTMPLKALLTRLQDKAA